MPARLVWNGQRVLAEVRRATLAGINETLDDAVQDAKSNHWWTSSSGQLEAEIVKEDACVELGGRIRGKFGTTKGRGFYGLFLERRTPFLRPAADRTFPRLPRHIRRRLA